MPESLQNVLKKKEIQIHVWLSEQLGAPLNKRMNPASHVGKYTHPDAQNIFIQAKARPAPKGYLCTGNFKSSLQDYVGSAALLPWAKTMEAILEDGGRIRELLLEGSPELQQLAKTDEKTFKNWKMLFQEHEERSRRCESTDSKMKQVYFPLGDGQYRLLTLLPCSVLIWELKARCNHREWGEEADNGKRKAIPIAFLDKWNKRYGGTKPQNIGFLNSQQGGRARTLTCLPPAFRGGYSLPVRDFFSQLRVYRPQSYGKVKNSLWDLFVALHSTLVIDPNVLWARRKKQGIVRAIIERGVILPAEKIRANAPAGWSRDEKYSRLPDEQKKWLDPFCEHGLEELPEKKWSEMIAKQIAGFVKSNFERVVKVEPKIQTIVLDNAFFQEVEKTAREYLDG